MPLVQPRLALIGESRSTRFGGKVNLKFIGMAETQKHQFSILATIIVTAAIAIWFALFQDASLTELAIFSGMALAAGIAGHLAYSFLLPWRITVVATVLLVYNLVPFSIMLVSIGPTTQLLSNLDFFADLVVQPAEMAMHVEQTRDILWMLAMGLVTAIFTPAHAIHPSLPTAIITALGIGAWYATSVLILSHGG